MIVTDNTTVVAYINKHGGTHSHSIYKQTGWDPFPPIAYINKQGGTHSHALLWLVVDLFLWLQIQDITIRARHIQGGPNQPITTKWSLHPKIVKQIFGTWGTPTVDMFATVHNTHLPKFMSPVPEPRALAIEALSQDWQGRLMYMFPPFPLLSSHSEAQDHSGGSGDTHKPLVAVTTVVSTLTTSVCGPPTLLSVPPRPTVTTGVCLEVVHNLLNFVVSQKLYLTANLIS